MSFLSSFGMPNVEKLKAKGDIQGLIKALYYPKNDKTRLAAARALGQMGKLDAVEPLIAALKQGPYDLRQAAANALGEIGHPSAIEPLITASHEYSTDIRVAAIKALSRFSDKQAVLQLINALQDENQGVRNIALEALNKILPPSEISQLAKEAEEKREQDARQKKINVLLDRLKWGNYADKQQAIKNLKELKWHPTNDSERVIWAITNRKWKECVSIGSSSVQPLCEVLKEASGGYPLAEKNKTNKVDQETFCAVLDALIAIGEPAIEPLSNFLQEYDNYLDDCIKLVVNGLGSINNPKAVAAVIKAYIAGAEKWHRMPWKMGEKNWIAEFFQKRTVDWRKWNILTTSIQDLSTVLKTDGNATRRFRALVLLEWLGSARETEIFLMALKDSDEDVRRRAARHLAETSETFAVEPLIEALQNHLISLPSSVSREALQKYNIPLPSQDVELCRSLIKALGKNRNPRAFDVLTTARQNIDRYIHRDAVIALIQISDSRSITPLIKSLKDEEEDVRYEAIQALTAVDIDDPQAANALAELSVDRKHSATLEKALEKLKWEPNNQHQRALRSIRKGDWATIVQMGSSVQDLVIDEIEAGLASRVERAFGTSGTIVEGGPSAGAIETLGQIGNEKAIATLLKIFDVCTWEVEYYRVIVAVSNILQRYIERVDLQQLIALRKLKGSAQPDNIEDPYHFTYIPINFSKITQQVEQELSRRAGQTH